MEKKTIRVQEESGTEPLSIGACNTQESFTRQHFVLALLEFCNQSAECQSHYNEQLYCKLMSHVNSRIAEIQKLLPASEIVDVAEQ